MGDGASLGYIQAVETAKKKTWYIGDIGNIAPIDKKKIQLSSVLWNFTGAYKQAIKDVDGGTFGVKAYDLDLKNGGISLLKTSYASAATWALVSEGAEGHHRGYRQGPVDDHQGRGRQARQGLDGTALPGRGGGLEPAAPSFLLRDRYRPATPRPRRPAVLPEQVTGPSSSFGASASRTRASSRTTM